MQGGSTRTAKQLIGVSGHMICCNLGVSGGTICSQFPHLAVSYMFSHISCPRPIRALVLLCPAFLFRAEQPLWCGTQYVRVGIRVAVFWRTPFLLWLVGSPVIDVRLWCIGTFCRTRSHSSWSTRTLSTRINRAYARDKERREDEGEIRESSANLRRGAG